VMSARPKLSKQLIIDEENVHATASMQPQQQQQRQQQQQHQPANVFCIILRQMSLASTRNCLQTVVHLLLTS